MKRRAPLLEIIVCLGPMFVFWPPALVLIPHQIMLAFRDGYWSALWTVTWYLGIVALAVAVRAMYVYIRGDGRKPFPTLVVQLCLIFGLIAIAIGPAGALVVAGTTSLAGWIFFVLLPLACVGRLVVGAKGYVLG
ncbi:hypothetical protein [Steroidobacter cummioxidans]|uniref:hypothetical protein n=1 Tax=Steroidobacter cummioxidans TaxID=1803913 RepID=UPI000E30E4FF|nr:hypothetical protein [Steroidobacter cummioxidans]